MLVAQVARYDRLVREMDTRYTVQKQDHLPEIKKFTRIHFQLYVVGQFRL